MSEHATWTEEMDQTLRRGYVDCKTVNQIARELGKTRGAITGRAFRLGLIHPKPTDLQGGGRKPINWTQQCDSFLIMAWELGASHAEIAESLKLRRTVVTDRLHKLGLTRQAFQKKARERIDSMNLNSLTRNEQIRKKISAGISQTALAKEYGISRQRIHQIGSAP